MECNHCGHRELLTKEWIAKVIGGTLTGGGFAAWVTFFFAGTGFALPICIALVVGGGAIMAYSTEITVWLSKKYKCPHCNFSDWRLIEGLTDGF